MSAEVEDALDAATEPDEAAEEHSTRSESTSRLSRLSWGRVLGTPTLVGVSFVLLYLWVSSQDLPASVTRSLNTSALRRLSWEHLQISVAATVIVLVIAVPLGITLTRPWARKFTPVAIAIANLGQGIPAIGTFVLVLLVFFRNGFVASIIGLAVYSALPVLRGTLVGLDQVDQSVIRAARGMGLSNGQVLRRIELPLSVPIVLTGIRTTLVLTVSTATLAAFVGGGGIGQLITAGQAMNRSALVVTGAVVAAGYALLADWVGAMAEDLLRPRGL